MTKVFCDVAISLDGVMAGPNQSEEQPFGEGIEGRLHRWMFDEPEATAAERAGRDDVHVRDRRHRVRAGAGP